MTDTSEARASLALLSRLRDAPRARAALLAAAALVLGAAVLAYRGPGRWLVRGHLGDVAATMLVYALVWLALPRRGSPAWRAGAAMVIATAIELGQTLWTGHGLAGELVLGGTFDAVDFLAYLAGAALAFGYERAAARRG